VSWWAFKEIMKKEYKKQFCLVCGKEIAKGKNVSVARYEKKKFCCSECSYKYLKENKLGWWNK